VRSNILSHVTISESLLAHSTRIEGKFVLKDGSLVANDIDFSNSHLNGPFLIQNSEIDGTINLNDEAVSGDLEVWESIVHEISLVSTTVSDQLVIVGSTLTPTPRSLEDISEDYFLISAFGLRVGRSLHLNRSLFSAAVGFTASEISGDFWIAGSKMPALFLNGTKIGGKLGMGINVKPGTSRRDIPSWMGTGELSLADAKVHILPILRNHWPAKIHLDGLTYDDVEVYNENEPDDWFGAPPEITHEQRLK
jgi:hypothetical protein